MYSIYIYIHIILGFIYYYYLCTVCIYLCIFLFSSFLVSPFTPFSSLSAGSSPFSLWATHCRAPSRRVVVVGILRLWCLYMHQASTIPPGKNETPIFHASTEEWSKRGRSIVGEVDTLYFLHRLLLRLSFYFAMSSIYLSLPYSIILFYKEGFFSVAVDGWSNDEDWM